MDNNSISVNKLSVLELLSSGQEKPFVIPEYQRPYSWGIDQITTLFDDLWSFSIEKFQEGTANDYFLGCVVSYQENGENQIIDGQQRITSLFLLLRAIFAMLEKDESNSKEVQNFINKIKPALWKVDERTDAEDRSQMLLRSEVVSDSENALLRNILMTGIADSVAKDNYSINYNKFIELYTHKAKDNALQIYNFILALLKYTILLPVIASDQETALTIFNTLNNRGMQLSDADIFKSQIYKKLDDEGKKDFISKWKDLETNASDVKESIQSLFYYHMFYLRAQKKDSKTTTPGIRKYYQEKGTNRLSASVIDDLAHNLKLWNVINQRQALDDEPWSQNMDIRKILDCLSSYPNEFWKYPVSIFFMQHSNNPDFERLFLKFLRKFCVMLLTKYLETPTISAVKGDILKLNVDIVDNIHPSFNAGFAANNPVNEFEEKKEKQRTDNLLIIPHRKVERMMLKLLAYDNTNQNCLLPGNWEIEHIFPQKWDTKYYQLNPDDTKAKLEHLGNKLPLEKKLNISASNNYFDEKKKEYRDSSIAICKEMGDISQNDWRPEDIETRDELVAKQLKDVFQLWIDDYDLTLSAPADTTPTPTQEEMKMIEQLRMRGLI
jgi:uncharacterized protein with ParB-like and HNH nuclease domain